MKRSDEDFKAEIEAHVALETDRLVAEGLSPSEAREAAIRKFGNVTAAKERFYESRRVMWVDQLRQDVRYAIRSFGRTPAFTIVAVVTLALGIGANTAIFSVINAVLLRPLPYKDSDRLVRIVETAPPAGATAGAPRPPSGINALEIAALRSQAGTLTHVGVAQGLSTTMTTRHGAVRVEGLRLSPAIFQMLGPPLAMGRLFDPTEEAPGADTAIILSYATWQRHFNGDPNVLGVNVTIDGRAYSVIGVTAQGFTYPDVNTHFWTPLPLPSGRLAMLQRMAPIARLSDGVSIEAATGEVAAIVAGVRRSPGGFAPPPPPPPGPGGAPAPPSPPNWAALAPLPAPQIQIMRLQDQMVDPVRPALLVLAAAVGVVLLIACVNVANLLLARTAAREREIAVRRALGAGPGRLVRQVFTESVVLALAGGLAGTALAVGGVRLLHVLGTTIPRRDLAQSASLPRLDEVGIDTSVFLFVAAASLVTGLLFGLAPALRHLRTSHAALLREGTVSAVSGFNLLGRYRMQGLLVVAEIAMATTLLVAGGLLLRSFVRLSEVDPGYDARNVLTFQVSASGRTFVTSLGFAEDLVARLQSLPAVRAAAYSEQLPTVNRRSGLVLRRTPETPRVPPAPPAPNAPVPPETPDTRFVSGDYLRAMGIEVVEGRGFGDPSGPRAILINRTMARSGFLGPQPIGQFVYTIGPEPWEIVGIVEDVRWYGLERDADPQLFFDLRQLRALATPAGGAPSRVEYFAVRTGTAPETIVTDLRSIVRQLDPQATVENIATLEQIVSNSISRPRLYAVLLGIFAAVAVMLAAIGIYGVMAYSVTQRVREIGIRMALGAEGRSVMRLVLGQSGMLTAIGIVAGLAGAAAITRYLERMLFGVTPLDPSTFAGVAVLFGFVAIIATVVPARRATRVDPVVALRCE